MKLIRTQAAAVEASNARMWLHVCSDMRSAATWRSFLVLLHFPESYFTGLGLILT
jgi:hypothetical protein